MSDRYEIREQIGKGGLGAVYKAFDNQLHREVAMKRVLTTEQGSEDEVEAAANNLIAEAQTLSSLNHPNIVTVFDIGRDDEGGFVVMELLKGETLDETVERGVLTQDDFIEVVHQTMEALIAAQASDVLHRDLKPTNVMVIWQPSGKFQTKILDFGLAKFSKTPSVQTMDQEDAVMGSIYFMAPEQFERAHLDARSDLYQIGCVYYHALTGQYPFRGETGPQVMHAHLQHQVTLLDKLRPDLSPSICQWVMWLINRDMENRPASAKDALERFPKNPEPPGEVVLQAIPVEETEDDGVTTGVQVVVPEHDAKPPPKLIVTGSAPISATAAKFHRHGKPSTAVDPAVKKKRMAIVGSVVGAIALVTVGLFFFAGAKEKAAAETLERLAGQESPPGSVKEVELGIKFLGSRKASTTQKQQAVRMLSKLEGTGIDARILEAMKETPDPYIGWRLSQVLANRGYAEAVPAMMTTFAQSNTETRRTDILNSIRRIAVAENADALLDALAAEKKVTERAQIESILLAIYRKQPEDEKVTEELLSRAANASPDERLSLFRILGALGGDKAMIRLRSVFNQGDQSDKTKRLAAMAAYLNWPDRSALEPLEKLIAEGAGDDDFIRSKAIEAYARISSLPAPVTIEEKIATWKKALSWSKEASEYQNIFVGTVDSPSAETLAFAKEHVDDASQSLSGYARKAVADIERLTKDSPVLASGGRLEPDAVILRGDGRGVVRKPVTNEDGTPVSPPQVILSNWKSPATWFVWHFKVKEAGNYGVEVIQADAGEEPSEFQVIIGNRSFDGKSKLTDAWDDFEAVKLDGTVSLEPGKLHTLYLKAHGVTQPRMMDIEAVRIVAEN